MAEIHLLEELCSKTHDILQVATQNLPIPAKEKARDVRKIISVFTYSLIKELSRDVDVHEDDIYLRYLMGGGLSAEQGRNIVNRTRDEFTKREFGEKCLQAGKQAVSKWLAGDRNIQSVLRDMLHNF
ncbi:MAG: hypothetical protein KJO81_12665 [Gammaproteobacteria bacterium]|nr:hypothetical protein [Gammaproteobacteria bacterium]MBT8125672.1 hypothetical protein [Gammaproteobacteria bacterium]